MSSARPRRRRLPARVYWVRRIVVLAVALLLVTGIGVGLNALTDGGDKSDKSGEKVAPTAAKSAEPSDGARVVKPRKSKKSAPAASQTPQLEEPEGFCDPADIAVSPFVAAAAAWRSNDLVVELKTRRTDACYWHVSPRSLTVAVTNRLGAVWTSRQCPSAVKAQQLVLRNDVGVKIAIPWSGRRSDDECSSSTRWAGPGWYRVEAAAFGGEPGQLLFELLRPEDLPAAQPSVAAASSGGSATGPSESQPTDYTGESGASEPNR